MFRYRFRKVLERPDWSPPVVAIIEVAYLPHPRRITDATWFVCYIKHPLGPVANPERIMEVQHQLAAGLFLGEEEAVADARRVPNSRRPPSTWALTRHMTRPSFIA